MRLLGVRVEVVQPRHPYITDGTHVGLLTRVYSLVDPELSLVVELFITEVALVQELATVFVLAVLPLAPVLVAGPTDGADIPWLVPANIRFARACQFSRLGEQKYNSYLCMAAM